MLLYLSDVSNLHHRIVQKVAKNLLSRSEIMNSIHYVISQSLERSIGHMWCVGSLTIRNKVCHLEKSIYQNKDRIHSLLRAGKSQHKIYAQIFPAIFRNKQRYIQTHILYLFFGNLADWITPHNSHHALSQLRLVVSFFNPTCRIVSSKVSTKPASMYISNNLLSQKGTWNI